MLNSVKDLETRGIGFESLHDKVDTTSAQGRLWFHFMGRHERVQADLVRERINAGLASAKARGQRLGPPTVM
jgi:DNA invertase Pin-like site-specific DNA recombinase